MQRAKEDVAANGKTDRDRGKKCGRRRAVLVSPYRGSMGREIGLPGADFVAKMQILEKCLTSQLECSHSIGTPHIICDTF